MLPKKLSFIYGISCFLKKYRNLISYSQRGLLSPVCGHSGRYKIAKFQYLHTNKLWKCREQGYQRGEKISSGNKLGIEFKIEVKIMFSS
jgi:hypothetical protein